jgi:formate-dependent nitrite reductase membrane component NrfD
LSGPGLDAELFDAAEHKAEARTTYNVDRKPHWGAKITGYLFFKSLAAGVFLAGAASLSAEAPGALVAVGVPLLSLIFLSITLVLLVTDLKRPERFLSMILRPNWSSWLAIGSFVLTLYAGLLTAWIAVGVGSWAMPLAPVMLTLTCAAAVMSAAYTAWLFGQAKGRVLWMKHGLALHLIVQAVLAGSACLLIMAWLTGSDGMGSSGLPLRWLLVGALVAHLGLTLLEPRLAPQGREAEYHRVARLVTSGPFARLHWLYGIALGLALPLVGLLLLDNPAVWGVAGFAALAGLWVEEDVLVRAGQALPIS